MNQSGGLVTSGHGRTDEARSLRRPITETQIRTVRAAGRRCSSSQRPTRGLTERLSPSLGPGCRGGDSNIILATKSRRTIYKQSAVRPSVYSVCLRCRMSGLVRSRLVCLSVAPTSNYCDRRTDGYRPDTEEFNENVIGVFFTER